MTGRAEALPAAPTGAGRELLRYCAPLVAANLLQSLYSLTDFFLAGAFIGDAALSAITSGGQIMALYTGVVIGLGNGGNVMIGQYTGGGLRRERSACTGGFLLLFLVLGTVSAGALLGLSHSIAGWMNAPCAKMAGDYIFYCAPGALAIAGYNAAAASLRGAGDSMRPLLFVGVSVAVNAALDILLMRTLRLGVAGAAAATAISQYVACFAAFGRLLFSRKSELTVGKGDFVLRRRYIVPILKIGFPCAVQMTVASISWLSVTVLLNGYGQAVSAAYGASARIKDLAQTVTSALAMASTAMIAQALGSEQYERAKSILFSAMKLAAGASVVMILFAELFAPQLIGLFTDGPDVLSAGVKNLQIEIVGQLFYAVFMIYHAMMTGAGHTGTVLFSSFVNCILVRSVLASLLSRIPGLGATGVYIACLIAPASSIPIGALYLRSGRWRRSLIQKAS